YRIPPLLRLACPASLAFVPAARDDILTAAFPPMTLRSLTMKTISAGAPDHRQPYPLSRRPRWTTFLRAAVFLAALAHLPSIQALTAIFPAAGVIPVVANGYTATGRSQLGLGLKED